MSRIKLHHEEDRQETRLKRAKLVAARMAVKYGSAFENIDGEPRYKLSEKHIREFWNYDETPPPPHYFRKSTNIPETKKIINERVTITDDIWNPDFIQGLCLNGKIKDKYKYRDFEWRNNNNIHEILSECEYGGQLSENKWASVPILEVKHSVNSFSYMAGLFVAGSINQKKDKSYVTYHGKARDEILKRSIPYEYLSKTYVMISPVWPALFSPFMPEGDFRDKWFDIKNPCNGSFYSTLLWKSYMDNTFPKDGLPFMKSRRTIYYKYKCKQGAMKRLESLRISTGLVEIDYIISDIVKYWGDKLKKDLKS